MASLSRKVEERLVTGLKRFQPILQSAKTRDVNEADTVFLVTDLLADLFGYDKYTQITREYAIRSTWCDLAVKIDDKPRLLIEVKAIGLDLKDPHIKQATDYAANLGMEWVALTNGANWKVYRIIFAKPIDQELVLDLDILTLSHRNPAHLDLLALLTPEGLTRTGLHDYHAQRQVMNRFSLAALLLSEPMTKIIRRELRRLSPGAQVDLEQIEETLRHEVLKREVIEGEKAEEAKKKLQRALRKQARANQKEEEEESARAVQPKEAVATTATTAPAA